VDKDGQSPFDILRGSIPLQKRVHESMPHVVQTRPSAVGQSPQPDLSGQQIERSMDVSDIQPIASAGYKEVWRDRLPLKEALASCDVVCKDVATGIVQGHKTGLAELCSADRQDSGLQIDIRKFKIPCFADAHT
jgi:hypothetical protein